MRTRTSSKASSDGDERELKLTVPPDEFDQLLRASTAVFQPTQPSRRIRQRTTYFDTADLALKNAGVALRLREAEGELVHSIKTLQSAASAGAAVRAEWEWSARSKAIDLRKLNIPPLRRVLARIQARQLKPVFRTEVDRTQMEIVSQGAVVELAFDRGYVVADGQRQEISEVEAELKRGDNPGVLYSIGLELHKHARVQFGSRSKAVVGYHLLNGEPTGPSKTPKIALAKDISVAEAFVQIMRQSIGQVTANQPALLEGAAEGIHQLRIGLRRIRTALRLFRECLRQTENEALKRELQWLGREVGEARDWDVFLARMLPLQLGDELVVDTVTQLTDFAHQRAAAAIRSPRYARLMLGLGHWLESNDWRLSPRPDAGKRLHERLAGETAAMLDDAAQGVFKLGRKLRRLDAAGRHELRKRAKKLRYSVEFVATLYPEKQVSDYVKTLKKLQRVLGDINDDVVARALYARVGATPDVQDFLLPEYESLLAKLPKAWKRFSRTESFWASA
jgi:inorganic triphosphatase YgiF